MDREKVIKGLEYCTRGDTCSSDCPYFKEFPMTDGRCITAVQADALALLKEQEARILGWDEIKNYSVVYGEFKGVSEIYPLIITFDSKGRALSWNPCINGNEECLLLTYDEEDRQNTRCWNKMPTEEQRKSVKWK